MKLPNFFKTRVGVISLHVLGWLIYYIRDVYEYFTESVEFDLVCLRLSYYFLTISTFYIFYYWAWPKFLRPGKYYRIIPGIAGGLVYFVGGRYLIQEVIYPATLGFSNYFIDYDFFFYVDDNWWRAFQMILYSAAIFLLVDRIRNDEKKRQAEKVKSEAALSFLRNQINPHFLFNMLSYLHTEAYLQDEKLAETIHQLSELLRYSTQKSNHKGARLEDEIYHLKNYTVLFQKRFGEKCFVEYEQKGEPNSQRVEPLLFIPFVENAFKHGTFSDREHPIKVAISIDNDTVFFECQNKVKQQNKDSSSGIGLSNVQQRLALLYPGKHKFKAYEKADKFFVELTLYLS